MRIVLINSEIYFKRKDLKSIPWFAIPNNILEHPDFFNISGDEFKAFVWILGVAAKVKKHDFEFDIRHASYMTKLPESVYASCLKKLHGKRLQVFDIIEDGTDPYRVRNGSVPNITEHNITKHNTTAGEIEPCGSLESGDSACGKIAEKNKGAENLFQIWNNHHGALPKAEALTAKRRRSANARWKEKPDFDYWVGITKKLAASDFCNARTGGKWVADFDFLLKPDTHVKVLEGRYDNRASPNSNSHLCLIGEPT